MVSKTKNPVEKTKRTRNVIRWQEPYAVFVQEAAKVLVMVSSAPKSELANRKFSELMVTMANLIKDRDATIPCISACDTFELVLEACGAYPESPRVSLPVIDACHAFINLFVDNH